VECRSCKKTIESDVKFCPECGTNISEKYDASNHIQKSICLVCKGKGERRMKRYMVASILIILFIFTPMLLAFGSDPTSTGIYGYGALVFVNAMWGFKKRSCSVCDGKGSILL